MRKIWNVGGPGGLHPYIGGGVSFVVAKLKTNLFGPALSDDAVGEWLGGGAYLRLEPRLNLGLSVRGSSAKVKLKTGDDNAGGGHVGLILGWGWPAVME